MEIHSKSTQFHRCPDVHRVFHSFRSFPPSEVGKCYYDGITPELDHPGGILAQSTRPLYLELRYEGSVTVDQWWIQLQRRAPEASEVVAAVKFIGSELLKALAFLSERPEPRFVHHDLRPEARRRKRRQEAFRIRKLFPRTYYILLIMHIEYLVI